MKSVLYTDEEYQALTAKMGEMIPLSQRPAYAATVKEIRNEDGSVRYETELIALEPRRPYIVSGGQKYELTPEQCRCLCSGKSLKECCPDIPENQEDEMAFTLSIKD